MRTVTAIKILFGVSAAAAGVYVSNMVMNDYRNFLQEQKAARELNVDYLARSSEFSVFPRAAARQVRSLEKPYTP